MQSDEGQADGGDAGGQAGPGEPEAAVDRAEPGLQHDSGDEGSGGGDGHRRDHPLPGGGRQDDGQQNRRSHAAEDERQADGGQTGTGRVAARQGGDVDDFDRVGRGGPGLGLGHLHLSLVGALCLSGGRRGGAGLLLGLSLQTGGEVLEQRRVGRPGARGGDDLDAVGARGDSADGVAILDGAGDGVGVVDDRDVERAGCRGLEARSQLLALLGRGCDGQRQVLGPGIDRGSEEGQEHEEDNDRHAGGDGQKHPRTAAAAG